MPYFPDEKILLIHIPKTAGIYVAKALGLDFSLYYDHFRPTLSESSRLLRPCASTRARRAAFSPKRLARLAFRFLSSPFRPTLLTGDDRLVGGVTLDLSLQNLTLSDILHFGYLSRDDVLSCHKVVTIRNPEDRFRSLVSYWHFLELGFDIDWVIENCLIRPNNSLPKELISTFSPMAFYIDNPLFTSTEWLYVRQESLLSDLTKVAAVAGLKMDVPKDKINSSESSTVALTDTQIAQIRSFYAIDYDRFHY